MFNSNDISFFLCCGFLPNHNKDILSEFFYKNNLSEFTRHSQTETDNESLIIEKGVWALKKAFENIMGNNHIVPLSGGLDSRTVLAGLIDAGLKDKIITVTFGTPDTYDFELPKMLARKLGLKHREFDLTKIKMDNDLLKETAKNGSSWTFLFDAYYNSLICKEFGKESTYWSGFIGGELAGSHLPLHESDSWAEAKRHFLKNNQFPLSIILSKPDYRLEDSLPSSPLIDRSIMTYDDQLDFALRQQNYIRRVTMFNDYDYRTPFLTSEWVKFIFCIPRQYRINKYIFKKILVNTYPELFSFPTANNLGGSLNISKTELYFRKILNHIHKTINNYPNKYTKFLNPIWRFLSIYQQLNYINFSDAIRNRNDYKLIVHDNIQDLKNRNILSWLDVDSILRDHQNMKNDNGLALILLSALEISLKASEN